MTERFTNFQKFRNHVNTIMTHRKVVRKWCFKMGIPISGILHDLSKYSPTEMSIYKFYSGDRSPHDNARDAIGYSPSWYHHKTRNKHHWEYWVDSLELRNGIKIPYKYVIEMFCDFVGAGQAYNRNSWNSNMPLEYHLKTKGNRIYHPDTLYLLEVLFCRLKDLGVKDFFKWYKTDKNALEGSYNIGIIDSRFSYEL